MMGAVMYRARAELRRRWPATLALVLLVGLAGGVVLTAVAGARRSSTAYERFRQETLAGDIDITTSNPDPERFAEVERLPQVQVVAPAVYPMIRPQGSDLFPYLEFLAVTSPDGRFGRVIDRPRVIEGRTPDPARSDELAITERLASERDLGVGERVAFESLTPEQFEALFSEGGGDELAGPVVTLEVVGVVRAPDTLNEGPTNFTPQAFLTPAFYDEHRETIGAYVGGSRARLRGGVEDAPAVTRAVRRIYADDPELEIQAASEVTDTIDDTLGVLVTALLLFAACAGAAGLVAVGQALGRHLSRSAVDQQALASMGMGRRQRVAALLVAALPVAAGGALLSVIVAIAASPLMPVSLARRAEPDLGLSVDGVVSGIGAAAVVCLVAGLALLAAWRSSRAELFAGGAELRDSARPSAAMRALTRAGLPPGIATGARMALEPGRGRAAVPVRSALAGTAIGVAGVVAAIVFAASLTGLVTTPSRYGFAWDAIVSGFSAGAVEERGATFTSDGQVRDFGAITSSLAVVGGEEVPVYGFETLKGAVAPTLIDGRAAAAPDEVALGTQTLQNVGVELGETVEAQGPEGPVPLRVVGRAALPVLDERSGIGRGAALTPDGAARLAAPDTFNRDIVVRWAPGVDTRAANRRLEETTGADVFTDRQPVDVDNLERVEVLPQALAAFLALLAILALVHTLVTTVRRRRHDLAVLRTIGFVSRQVAATVATQAITLALVGVVVGVPLGIVAGRAAWALVADGIRVVNRPEVPLLATLLAVVAALAVANVAAAVPAWAAARTRPATILRSE